MLLLSDHFAIATTLATAGGKYLGQRTDLAVGLKSEGQPPAAKMILPPVPPVDDLLAVSTGGKLEVLSTELGASSKSLPTPGMGNLYSPSCREGLFPQTYIQDQV